MALEGIDYAKHSGVISHFQKNYIKTKIFDISYSKIVSKAFQIRNLSDYDDMYIASKEEAESQIVQADYFLHGIKEYLKQFGVVVRQQF